MDGPPAESPAPDSPKAPTPEGEENSQIIDYLASQHQPPPLGWDAGGQSPPPVYGPAAPDGEPPAESPALDSPKAPAPEGEEDPPYGPAAQKSPRAQAAVEPPEAPAE